MDFMTAKMHFLVSMNFDKFLHGVHLRIRFVA